jgi:hypothetical protein
MANKDQSKGLEPYGKVIHQGMYTAGATLYPGDMVKMADTGLLVACAAGTAKCIGVALTHATSGNPIAVADAPEQEFSVQADDATVAAQTNIGLNYNITVGTASTLYRRSAMELDASTGATDSNLPLRAIRLAPAVDNAFGDQADVIVKINNHQRGDSTEGL